MPSLRVVPTNRMPELINYLSSLFLYLTNESLKRTLTYSCLLRTDCAGSMVLPCCINLSSICAGNLPSGELMDLAKRYGIRVEGALEFYSKWTMSNRHGKIGRGK